MLQVKNLTKAFGKNTVLKNISFNIEKGTIYGFLGRNGAGKTTTMNILSGILQFDDGEIIFDGKNYKSHKREILNYFGYVPQNPVFYDYMTAREYLNFIALLTEFDPKQIKQRIEEVLLLAGLSKEANKKLKAFSGGMKQRFSIAVAIFNKPELLILDEPTASLDPEGRIEILNFVRSLKSSGTTVFLSTHILNDIERVGDELSIIEKGEILVSDSLANLRQKYLLPIIEIEAMQSFDEIAKDIRRIEGVSDVKNNVNSISIYANDISKVSSELIQLLASQDFPIISFNQKKSNLDDIFMRLINENL